MADSAGTLGRLDGWKAIAAHFNRNVRTVQRWERAEGLPVHRHSHKKMASAWAYCTELDEWMSRRSVERMAAEATETSSATHPADDRRGSIDSTRPTSQLSHRSGRRWFAMLTGFAVATSLLIGVTALGGGGVELETRDEAAYSDFAEGRALYDARQYVEALSHLERAVARDSKFGSAWAQLAKAYGRLGHRASMARAVVVGERANEVAPQRAETHIGLALIARAQQNLKVWRVEASRAIDLDPRAGEAYAVLADSYSGGIAFACNRDQNPELAENYYRRAVEVSPDLTIAVMNRSKNLRQLGRYSECDELLTRAMGRHSDSAMAASRGMCRLMRGDLIGAAADIEPLREDLSVPRHRALTRLGWLQIQRGQVEDGLRDLDRAATILASTPVAEQLLSTPEEQLTVAALYADTGEPSRAAIFVNLALQNDPACAEIVANATSFFPSSLRTVPEVMATLAKYEAR